VVRDLIPSRKILRMLLRAHLRQQIAIAYINLYQVEFDQRMRFVCDIETYVEAEHGFLLDNTRARAGCFDIKHLFYCKERTPLQHLWLQHARKHAQAWITWRVCSDYVEQFMRRLKFLAIGIGAGLACGIILKCYG